MLLPRLLWTPSCPYEPFRRKTRLGLSAPKPHVRNQEGCAAWQSAQLCAPHPALSGGKLTNRGVIEDFLLRHKKNCVSLSCSSPASSYLSEELTCPPGNPAEKRGPPGGAGFPEVAGRPVSNARTTKKGAGGWERQTGAGARSLDVASAPSSKKGQENT